MAKRADCRKCVYYLPEEEMDWQEKENALAWIARHRPGKPLLGWCKTYRRPITYYTGSCYRYRPKTRQNKPSKTITMWLEDELR